VLTIEQLRKYYPPDKIIQPKNILVEYLQCELLDSIYKQKESDKLSFMGGTSIRIVHDGNRFSEDLDFDNFGLAFSDFEELFKEVIHDMKQKGFVIEFRFVEKGAYHCYIKFPHILQDNKISDAPREKIFVRIDTVLKEKFFKSEFFNLNKFDLYRNIIVNPIDIILSQKLITILQRKREKGRDFYDVSYLFSKTKPNFEYIESCLKISKEEFGNKLTRRCYELNFEYLARDVEPFLIEPKQLERVLDFKNFIQKEMNF
jgi:predicted nucleotidyltransferase component of viral defense system